MKKRRENRINKEGRYVGMDNIKIKEGFDNCRALIYKPKTRQFLLSRIAGSEQETDMSVPSNCDGYGRIHHFRRNVDKWINDSLPNDPACKALEIPYTDVLEAQVFQLASCNVHCWYCFVPDKLKCGRMDNAKWLTAEQMVELYKKSDTEIRVIDLSGGNPELALEWTLDTMKALERNKLQSKVYLWSDDTLTTDYAFEYLSKEELNYMASYRNFGKVGCFKGFDAHSFAFNSNLPEKIYEKQFERFERYVDMGFDIYGYVTLTSDNYDNIEEKMEKFVDRLQKIHPILPLRIVPLKIFNFTPTGSRLNSCYSRALENQIRAIEAWKAELSKRYSEEKLAYRISDNTY